MTDKRFHKRLKTLLHYDPKTGRVTWLVSSGGWIKAGERAGSLAPSHHDDPDANWRRVICIDGTRYLASRLIWFYMTGRWPKKQIDHKNGNTLDNRWKNLREASNAQNMYNRGLRTDNTSGFKGVSKRNGRYVTQIKVNGKLLYIRGFTTREQAAAAYRQLAIKHHGEFARFD